MAERSKDFLLNTLKGKVWLAVIVLAVINAVVGVIGFFAVSFVTANPLVPMLAMIVSSSLMTIVFAWWVSNALMAPLEKLTLLAKGIERSPGMTLPKTTGSFETDELLNTISRTSQQLVNFIALMDDVTAGKTDAVLNPLEHSDRISASFQKLVSKVTDSIDAKKELDELQLAVQQISGEVSGLQRGDQIHVRSDFEPTRTITDALRFLIDSQTELTRRIQINAGELRNLTSTGKKRMRAAVEKDDARNRKIKSLTSVVTGANSQAERSMRELSDTLRSVSGLIDQLTNGSRPSEHGPRSLASVRAQFDAALHKLQNVGEQSLAITHVSKSVQDLARRSNMIAVNTSIQASAADQSLGLSTLTQEMTSLSERAEKANKAIAAISDSVVRDVNEAYASLQWVTSEVTKMSEQAAKDEDAIVQITEALIPLAELPAKMDAKAAERSVEVERMVQILEDCSARADEVSAELQSCEESYLKLLKPLDDLSESPGGRRQILTPIAAPDEKWKSANGAPPAATDDVNPAPMLEL